MPLRSLALAFAILPAALVAQGASDVLRAFEPFDLDGDGVKEVLRCAPGAEVGDPEAPLVVVLCESRLLTGDGSARWSSPLGNALTRFAGDVAAAGFRAVLVDCTVHGGPPHQDGRTVLALRVLLRDLAAAKSLAGAVLVGHFPDALLVRTCNWRRQDDLDLPGRDGKPVHVDGKATLNVRCVPEIVAHRCDVVLADLDGDWEKVYVPGPAALPSVTVVFGDKVPDAGGPALAMQTGELKVVDAFHVRDGRAAVDRDAFAVRLDAADRDHECSAGDRARDNPMALPDIAVSRIDARGVALLPEAGALDAAGRPIACAAGDRKGIAWRHDLGFERQLLCDYFDRNHAFRTQGRRAEQHRPAAFGHELGSGLHSLRAADAGWSTFAEPGYDVHERADLVALLRWLQRPAVLRVLRVHSDPWGGACAATDPAALTAVLGVPWHWVRDGERLVPAWTAHRGGKADFAFYRTLWQRQVVPDHPFLLIHTGCEALSPPGCVERAYDDPGYGQHGHAESLLFFTPCLAMVGRAKVFYDEPRGFAAALGEGRTFGEAWQRYFATESAAADWREVGEDIGRKRAYFWSVVGDWTLRLPR